LLGFGPFARETQNESLLLLQTFMGSTALMAMAFSAVVSERKRAEETNARLAAIVESSNDAIIGKTLDGLVTSWNKGAERIFGYSLEEMIGKPGSVLIPADRHNEEREIIERLKRGERIEHYETGRRRKDGKEIDVSLTISPIRDNEGRIIGASKIARDITDHKRAEEALRESEERLAADLDAMTRLQKVGTLFVREGGVPAVLDEIVEGAIAITGADMGNIQLLDARSGSLKIVAHRGFEQPFLDFWNTVHKGEGSCGTALERGERVIVEDVTRSPIFVGKPALEVMLEAGARAVQSTMLLSRSGRLLGVFSTHYRTPRRPDERALRLLDVLARQTADLIERAQAEAALRESETRFRVMADSTPALVWTSGPDALFTFFNKPWLEFTGQTLEHELGNGWTEDIHPEDRQRCLEIYRSAFDARKEFKMEYRLRRADGEYRWILDNGVPRYESDGTFAGYVGSCIDITEDKRVADEIRRLNVELEQRVFERTAQLEASNKELESFSYSVSHDLRAPLRSIDGFSLALLEDCADKLSAQGKDYLRRVRDATQRMARLIDDLLNLARVTREGMRRERVNLSMLARSIAADLKKTQPDRQVAFVIADGLVANGDAHLLRVALQNLLGNAWKFTSKRPKTRIEFGVIRQNGTPAYFVRDDGAGFDMVYAGKLFGPFQRLHSAKEFEGTGIGLATVKRVIRRHGGRVWAESAVGQGATFYFTLQPSEGSWQLEGTA
ncbi:MAG TPA: PAS domain S-box protein, partial [Nitrospiraceae bacterium]|nr:PAS domain S-box protein [Nitrospiraceae bacterium]